MAKFTEVQKEGRRQQILAAALRCFARNGFHNTTITDVVRESGVSQGTFYLYFETKDDVIAALADDRSQSDALINAIAGAETDPVVGLTILFDLHGRDPRRCSTRRRAARDDPRLGRGAAQRGDPRAAARQYGARAAARSPG